MSELNGPDFLRFLHDGVARGGFETDDTLATLLPLMKQTLDTHEAGLVAPLDGINDLLVTVEGFLKFAPEKAVSPAKNISRIDELQAPVSRVVEVVAFRGLTSDVDRATLTEISLDVATAEATIGKPVYMPGYRSWEHAIGHHDALTDVFSLGMLLASISCGLDFTDLAELAEFTTNRANLFRLNPRLHPIVASVIVQMTELNRHKRAPDLAQLINRLENYRDLPADLNFNLIEGFTESGLTGKRRLIQSRLRDRLFDLSRRNRLIYFKATAQTLNLTVASVPILLDYKNIKLEHLFVWHTKLAAAITDGGPLPLGKYLRFEDACLTFPACWTRSSAKRAGTGPSLALGSYGSCSAFCAGTISRTYRTSASTRRSCCCRSR